MSGRTSLRPGRSVGRPVRIPAPSATPKPAAPGLFKASPPETSVGVGATD